MATAHSQKSWLHANVIRLARVHFLFVAVFSMQTIMHDAWNLIAPNAVLYRWILSASLLVITTAVWYLAKNTITSTLGYKLLIFLLIIADITAASMNVYAERGMASLAVALYAIPIAVSAVLLSRAALFATAALAAAAYSATAVAYFVLNFNEGYKYQLYSEVGLYSFMFFILASLIWIAIRTRRQSSTHK